MQPQQSIPINTGQTNSYSNTPRKPKGEGLKSVLTTVGLIILAPLLALLLTNFVFQSYEVDGPSMETTLQNGDRLIVWKLPRTLARLSGDDYIPDRGEVVIFVKRGLYGDDGNEKSLVKRVIGLPGDRVAVVNGKMTIYNDENPEGFNPDEGQVYSLNVINDQVGNVDIRVKEGEVFVVGDNRPNSLDSRSFGTVPAEDLVGSLAFRILPVNKARAF